MYKVMIQKCTCGTLCWDITILLEERKKKLKKESNKYLSRKA